MRVVGSRSVFLRGVCTAVLALSFVWIVGVGQPASAQSEVFVDMPDFNFVPATITVPVGTKVTWRHTQMGVPHDVTSDEGVFSSPRRMMAGQSYSYTFTQPGTYPYTCTIHAQRQKGTIIVTAQTTGSAVAGGAATARPAATGTGGGAALPPAPTARPTAAPVMPATGRGPVEGAGMTNWLLLAGGLIAAGALCVGGFRLRRVRE